ncbi:hypothetical protein [Rhodoligotrophos defluvii]|uniref:hypothetical protein n=1 Tax=Rhodoligotrophos defluvii TaxID=2561934 RepID=UPI001EF0724B|nr:hypothetical protein [Rhodoligotrophos defluvii]
MPSKLLSPHAAAAALLLGIAVALPSLRAAADDLPSYADFTDGVFLPYLNAGDGDLTRPPRLGLSLGGRMLAAVVDSGSTGIVVAAAYMPDWQQLESVGEGRITYTSSGRVMSGQWVITPVTVQGADGSSVATTPMPVLVVTEVTCLEHARNCQPNDDPHGIAMIGIGFAREHDAQAQGTPDKNPLLQVAAQEGQKQRRGYILTQRGVHVGLTGANTRGTFRAVKLDRQQTVDDWSPIPACISINGTMPPACGTMLADTGVTAMFLTVPASQAGENEGTLPPGTEVSLLLNSADGAPSELYSFTADDGSSPLAPSSIHLRVSPERTFVNTSLHILNGFDVLYDADGGYVGFRARAGQ